MSDVSFFHLLMSPRREYPAYIKRKIRHQFLSELYLSRNGDGYVNPSEFAKDDSVINGLLEYEAILNENVSIDDSLLVQAIPMGDSVRLNLTEHFKPGNVVAIR